MIATRPRDARTGHRLAHLLAKDISCSSRGNSAVEPFISPVHQPKAIDLPIITRSFDQTKAASAFEAPEARQRRVKGELHFVLKIEICARQQGEEVRQIGGKLLPQISFD
jgi:hypothetical protein